MNAPTTTEHDLYALLNLLILAEKTLDARNFLFVYAEEAGLSETDSPMQLLLKSYDTALAAMRSSLTSAFPRAGICMPAGVLEDAAVARRYEAVVGLLLRPAESFTGAELDEIGLA